MHRRRIWKQLSCGIKISMYVRLEESETTGLKICEVCGCVLHSTCSKAACKIDGKRPMMILHACNQSASTTVSSKVWAPPWNIGLKPFYLAPPPPSPPHTHKKILHLSDVPFMSNPPKNFGELDSSPLKCTLVQRSKDLFFKETKDLVSNNEIRTHLNVEIWICSCKI